MDYYWKTIAGILIASIMILELGKKDQDFGLLLTMAVCSMAAIIILHYLQPVFVFLNTLEEMGNLRNDHLLILLKAVGIAVATEIASLSCAEAGSGSLGKIINMLGSAVILYISLPMFYALLELIRNILGET